MSTEKNIFIDFFEKFEKTKRVEGIKKPESFN